MGRSKLIEELTTLLAIALRHKIGSIVNENELYAQKYAKDSEVLIEQAKKLIMAVGFNIYEKKEIKNMLKLKLRKELEAKTFLSEKKFGIMDGEADKCLDVLGLASGDN
jgi:hypothetical protein